MTLSSHQLERAAAVAERACDRARKEILPRFRSVDVEFKQDGTPVTEADRAAERAIREVLRDAVIEGTGRPARSTKYQPFGKSGTPQLPNPEGGGYYENRYIPTFIAGAPFEDPRIVVLCVIDDPVRSTGYFGGPVAGPVVRDVIDGTLEYLGVARDVPTE